MSQGYKTRGFTIVELVVAMGVFAVIMAFALAALGSSATTSSMTVATGNTQERVRIVVDQIANEIEFSSPDVCTGWNFPDQTEVRDISFSRPIGYDAASSLIQWGDVIRYVFELDAGESADGIDNDGDGLIDEATLYRVEAGETVPIATNLYYGNCSFYRVGDQIFIRCCCLTKNADKPDEPEEAYLRKYETSVTARN